MLFSEICNSLDCRVYYKAPQFEDVTVQNITAGDLMSEVLVFDHEHALLVTALNSEQVLRTAAMVDALGVLLVNSKVPGEKMISLAEDLDISLMSTSLSMFDSCVALHQLMNKND